IAAVTLLDGDAFIDQFAEDRLADRNILDLIPRIEISHDSKLDAGGAAKRHAVHIDATLKSGERLSAEIEQRRGSADHPLSSAEVERKFRRLASVSRASSDIDELVDAVHELERNPDLERLITLITRNSENKA